MGDSDLPDADTRRTYGFIMWAARPWDWRVCKCVAAEVAPGKWRIPRRPSDWLPDPTCPHCGGYGAVHARHWPREWGWTMLQIGRLTETETAIPCPRCVGDKTPRRYSEFLPDPTCPTCSGVGCVVLVETDEWEISIEPEFNIRPDGDENDADADD